MTVHPHFIVTCSRLASTSGATCNAAAKALRYRRSQLAQMLSPIGPPLGSRCHRRFDNILFAHSEGENNYVLPCAMMLNIQ